MTETSEREKILKEYSKAFKKYINENYVGEDGLLDERTIKKEGKEKHVSYSKIDGCVFAHIIKNKIDSILKGTGYHTSINNSYIKDCFTEWDLLICKGKSKYNIHDPKDVLCAIELKAGGLAGYNKEIEIIDFFKKVDEALKQSSEKIKYLYISLNDSKNKADKIKELIKNNYKGKFFYYFVTTDSWHYNEWNDNNLLPSKRDDSDKKLKEVLEDILGTKTV